MSVIKSDDLWQEAVARSLAMARQQTPQPDLAEDIAQEALIRAWTHRERLRDAECFFAWLSSIVRNEAARVHARRRPEPVAEPPDLGHDDERLSDAALRLDVQRSLGNLGAAEREILRLRYVDDLTQAAIAERLDMPEGTVKVTLHRARLKLRDALCDE